MTVFTRRNELVGWATWSLLKWRARRAAALKKQRRKRMLAAVFAILSAIGAIGLVRWWRSGGPPDEWTPPASDDTL